MGSWTDSDGAPSMKFFHGGSGDDKVWLVNPADIDRDEVGDGKAYGGLGNDLLYGTRFDDILGGDEYLKTDDVIGEMDTRGGDDVIKAYGGNDTVQGGFGNDILDGGDDDDIMYGQIGDDTIYGGEGNDRLHGDDV